MRDDFQPNIVRDLANRVGNRCSNPDCTRHTSGPTASPSGSISIGVGAHITAAAIGGPRYDATLSATQRSSIENGIWLCQTCSRLIDRDAVKYTKELLLNWKAGAEFRAKTLLETPELPSTKNEPLLNLPETNPAVSWLAFSARVTRFLGRENEAEAIESFLQSKQSFAWWLITGPAGAGKSRLALETCRSKSVEWHAGFLSKTDQFKDWSRLRPTRPTLIVMDYVASRAEEAGSMLLQLSRAAARLPYPVRVLLLERDKGSWWSEATREGSQSESAEICSKLFGGDIPELKGLTSGELTVLAKETCESLGLPWSPSTEREFKRRIYTLDTLGRPLFAMMATRLLGLTTAELGVSASLLDLILKKESGRRKELFSDAKALAAIENLIMLATLVGGLLPSDGGFDFLKTTSAKDLMHDFNQTDFNEYCNLVGAPSSDTSLPGLQPDILGERFVLKRIGSQHPLDQSFKNLLLTAWAVQGAGLSDFVVRAASDFPEHPSLAKLCDLPLSTPETRARWGRLVAELVRVTGKSDSAFVQPLVVKLRQLSDSFDGERELRTECARAELYLGNILTFIDDNPEAALAQFQETMRRAGAGSDMEASAINNRGILHSQMQDAEKAFEDWSNVIVNTGASDEARACSFNNRADIFADKGEHEKAIADRSSVLALKNTSPDRRYIALIRRSRSYLATNQMDKALEDLRTLLATEDIAPQQKAEALNERGNIYTNLNDLTKAQNDFGEVLAIEETFSGAVEKALVGLAEVSRLDGDSDRAETYLMSALESREIRSDTFIRGLIITACLLNDAGESNEAQRVWETVAKDPRSTTEQRAVAKKRIEELKSC